MNYKDITNYDGMKHYWLDVEIVKFDQYITSHQDELDYELEEQLDNGLFDYPLKGCL